MSSYDPSGSTAQQWVLFSSMATIIVAGVALGYVVEPVQLMSFLGWETAVCVTAGFSILLAIVGIYSACVSRSGRSSSFYCWNRFGVALLYQLFALLYLCLHTIISQPLGFYELKKHWSIVSWRFPAFANLNETQAIMQAETYYNYTVTVVGVLAVLLLVLNMISVGCVVRTMNSKVLFAYIMPLTSVLAAMIGSVLVGFGVLVLRHTEFYGDRAQVPLQIFLNACFFLGIAAFGMRAIRAKPKDLRCSWCLYFWWAIISLLLVIGCAIGSILFLENQFAEIDAADMNAVRKASGSAGLASNDWTKDDYKQVLNGHFSQIFAMLTFLGLTLIVILTSSVCVRAHENKNGYRSMRVQ